MAKTCLNCLLNCAAYRLTIFKNKHFNTKLEDLAINCKFYMEKSL